MSVPQFAHTHRAIGSVIYDALIVLGLLMVAGFAAVGVHYWVTGAEVIPQNLFFQLYVLIITIGYFIYFWKRSGQTVGMKAWRIKLVSLDDTPLTYKKLAVRMLVAIPAYLLLGLGVLWQYWDRENLNWQDKASQTKLIYLPKMPANF